MADKKISALPASTTPLAGTEVLPIVQSGATKQVSVANLTAGRAISASSVTASTGNFVVGTSGQGVDFSATPGTGTSELLADYEEGTWTPTDASGAGLAFTVNSATYIKVGNSVTISAYIIYPTTANGNTASIGGKPFDSAGNAYHFGTGRSSAYPVSPVTIQTNPGVGNLMSLYIGNGSFSNASMTGATLFFSLTYLAA